MPLLFKFFHKIATFLLICAFLSTSFYIPQARAGEIVLPVMPAPGTMVQLSPAFTGAHLQGITIHPDNALQFDFLIHKGDGRLNEDQKKQEYTKLIKYFLASLTVPDKDQWVNLSPYEKGRIIDGNFGKTEMGRDLLEQDYLLKQLTSSLMYPEKGLGKNFWDKVYALAWKEYHTTNIPVNTFNKVWIIPDEAVVYESGNTAYIIKSHLKIMLEEDYLSLKKHFSSLSFPNASVGNPDKAHTVASQVIRQVILPQIEREVNEGKNFAQLRQIVSGMILATWYKKALKESLLGKVYADKTKIAGLSPTRGHLQKEQQKVSPSTLPTDSPLNVKAPQGNNLNDVEAIYQRYLQAFKKGVYNYIKEDTDKYTHQTVPRKYFAGGFERGPVTITDQLTSNLAMVAKNSWADAAQTIDSAMVDLKTPQSNRVDAAMSGRLVGGGIKGIDPQVVRQFKQRLENAGNESGLKSVVADIEKYLRTADQIGNLQNGTLDNLLNEFNAIANKKHYVIGSNPHAKGKRALLLFRILGDKKTYQNKYGFINLYELKLKTEDQYAIAFPRWVFSSLVSNHSLIFIDNINTLARKYERIRRGEVLLLKIDPSRNDKIEIERLLDIASKIIRIALFDKNREQISVDLESAAYSMAFEHHRAKQMGGMPGGQFNKALVEKFGMVFALYDEANPVLYLGSLVEATAVNLFDQRPGAWETLYRLSGKDSPTGVYEWLKTFLEIKGTPAQVRQQIEKMIREDAKRYYVELSGRGSVELHNGFHLYNPPKIQIRIPSETGKAAAQPTETGTQEPGAQAVGPNGPAGGQVISLSSIEQQLVDRYEPVRSYLRRIFDNPRSGINRLIIAIANERHGDNPYHEALEAIAAEASLEGGVSKNTLMAEDDVGVTVIEAFISEVMQGIDRLKNLSFREYFDDIYAAIRFRSMAADVEAASGNGTNAANETKGPEVFILKNTHIRPRSTDIDDAKRRISKIYQIIKQVEEGQLPVQALNQFTQRSFPGIFRDDLKDDWVFYFRYLRENHKFLIIAIESKEIGHHQAVRLSEDYKTFLEYYSSHGPFKFEELGPDQRQSIGILDAAMIFMSGKKKPEILSSATDSMFRDVVTIWNIKPEVKPILLELFQLLQKVYPKGEGPLSREQHDALVKIAEKLQLAGFFQGRSANELLQIGPFFTKDALGNFILQNPLAADAVTTDNGLQRVIDGARRAVEDLDGEFGISLTTDLKEYFDTDLKKYLFTEAGGRMHDWIHFFKERLKNKIKNLFFKNYGIPISENYKIRHLDDGGMSLEWEGIEIIKTDPKLRVVSQINPGNYVQALAQSIKRDFGLGSEASGPSIAVQRITAQAHHAVKLLWEDKDSKVIKHSLRECIGEAILKSKGDSTRFKQILSERIENWLFNNFGLTMDINLEVDKEEVNWKGIVIAIKRNDEYILDEYYTWSFREKLAKEIERIFFGDTQIPDGGSAESYDQLSRYNISNNLGEIKGKQINGRDDYICKTFLSLTRNGERPWEVLREVLKKNNITNIKNLSGEAIVRLVKQAVALKASEPTTTGLLTAMIPGGARKNRYQRQMAQHRRRSFNRAQLSVSPGGIDLNSVNMDLQIKRDGRGVPLPLAQQDMAQLSRIQGFVPVILEIKPAANLPILSELKQSLQNQSQKSAV